MSAVADTRFTSTQASDSGRFAIMALALLAPVGAVMVGLLRYVLPYETTDSAADMVREGYADPAAMSLVLWFGLAAVLVIVPGSIAIARLVRPGAPRLTAVALTLTIPAYLMLPILLIVDHAIWAGAETGAAQTSVVSTLEAAHPVVGIATGIFVVGHVLGTVVLGLAMLRSRRVPVWAAVATIVSQPLHFVAAVIVPNHTLDGAAWGLNALGFAAAAVALIRTNHRPTDPL
jgi:hypothetical protein